VFVFYQFNRPPLHFNQSNVRNLAGTVYEQPFRQLEKEADSLFNLKQQVVTHYTHDAAHQEALAAIDQRQTALQVQGDSLIHLATPDVESKDRDYVFIHFVLSQLPAGLIGLILSMIFCASWSTTASELNALTSTTVSDIYKRSIVTDRDDTHYFRVSRWVTVLWGAFITIFATYADLFDNLIQAVNMVGSIFYGTILGIFFTAFFLKKVKGNAVFWGAVVAQTVVAFFFFQINRDMYLWYNPLGCGLVMGIAWLLQTYYFETREQATRQPDMTP
jgi:solute:Na+ symporter, SSS family